MESSNSKSTQKLVKRSSQSSSPSARGVMGSILPQQISKNQSPSRDEPKKRQGEKSKVSSKPLTKENTLPLDFKLHTHERFFRRAVFNYSVATKLYLMEQQKRTVEKLQKMIEEEEVRMLRKEMIPKAQLMPFFDRPFFPQRSTRRLTIPREPSFHMINGKCSTRICGSEAYNVHHYETQ